MSEYHLVLANHRVEKGLDRLGKPVLERMRKAVQVLGQNPRPPAARKLRHPAIGEHRLHTSDWRVLYDVDEEAN
jgi:mRNA-degrading endonuclease RelE of RelBE toxin-antitoxin system